MSEYQREYYARNREKLAERARRRRREDPEPSLAAHRRYYARNRERILAAYRERHYERKSGKKLDPERRRENVRRYESWARVRADFTPLCPSCGTQMTERVWKTMRYLRCGGCGLETSLLEIKRIQVYEAA